MPEKQVNLKSFKSTFKLVGQNAKIHFSESQQIFLLNLLKKDIQGIQTIVDNNNYRPRILRDETKLDYSNAYDRLMGELGQTTIDAGTREK